MAAVAEFHSIPLDKLHESKLNPRKHFDPAALQELAASIKAHGVLTPLLVRPNAKGFEIAAGHRRYRAAKLADVAEVPAVVRDMSDLEFLEVLVVENDQREDVHPLEQAAGYKALMLLDGYDAKRIADRIGRSEKFVYDRMKLLQLTPLAQQLFLAGKMAAGHAILIARLTKEQQERIVGVDDDSYDERHLALFQSEHGEDLWDLTPAQEKERKKDPLAKYEGYKPVSVRELDAWIDEHVRLDPKKVDPFLFPAVVEAVATAPKDLVPLSREHSIADDARDPKVRTWRPGTWKEVKDPAKACKYTQAGIIVVGPGRGDVLQVCLNSHRDQCTVHWSKESKEAAQMRKIRAGGGSTGRVAKEQEREARRQQDEERRRKAEQQLQARYRLATPKILEALGAAIDKAALRTVGAYLLAAVKPYGDSARKVADLHPFKLDAEGVLRHAVFSLVSRECNDTWRAMQGLPKEGKRWGVDVAAILEKVAPEQKEEKKTEPKAEKKVAPAVRQTRINKAAKKAAKK